METRDPDAQTSLVKELSLPIYQSKGWMKFIGILSIIQGIFIACTIVGILIAWLPIWMGVLLYQASKSIEQTHVGINSKEAMLKSLGKIKLFFAIMGITLLVSVIIVCLSIFGGLGAIIGTACIF